MAFVSALLIVAALASPTARDLKAYSACRAAADAVHNGGCAWRSGSLFFVMGSYPVRIAFRDGHPSEVVIDQPGTSKETEFLPEATGAFPLHDDAVTAIDGNYLTCVLRQVPDPTDPTQKLSKACFAGTRYLRAGTISWVFSQAPPTRRVRRRP